MRFRRRIRQQIEGARERVTVSYGPKYTVGVVSAPPGRDFICFEPMSAVTNAFNLAHAGVYRELQSIPPGGVWRESFRISATGFCSADRSLIIAALMRYRAATVRKRFVNRLRIRPQVEGARERVTVSYGPKYTVAVLYAPPGRVDPARRGLAQEFLDLGNRVLIG